MIKRKKIAIGVLSLLFTLFIIVGYLYCNYGTFFKLFSSLKSFCIFFFISIIIFIIFNFLIKFLFNSLDNFKYEEKANNKFDQKIVLVTFILSLTFSIIYLIGFYPGIVPWDGMWQLDSAFGIRTLNNHHPAMLSLFMGGLMNIGRFFGSDNLGIFLYILLQIIINALIYSYVLKIFRELKISFKFKIAAMIFFTCFPLLVLNSITYIKDTIYYLLILLYFVYSYYHFRINETKKIDKYLKLFLILTLIFLFRNTGFYVGLISLFSLILFYRKKIPIISRNFFVLFIGFLMLKGGYTLFLMVNQINNSPIREMLSIPLQQTARYLTYYEEDLNEQEKENLSSIFLIDLKEIKRKYNPNKSDPIKWVFKAHPTTEEFLNYCNSWFTMFLHHPLVYVDATLNNIYGYFGPGIMNAIDEEVGIFKIEDNKRINTGYFDIHFYNKTKPVRNFIEDLSRSWGNFYVINLMYYCFTYVWIIIFVTVYLIYKKSKTLIIYMMPLYVTIFTCIISPLNAHMRYLMPVVVCLVPCLAFLEYENRLANKSNLLF